MDGILERESRRADWELGEDRNTDRQAGRKTKKKVNRQPDRRANRRNSRSEVSMAESERANAICQFYQNKFFPFQKSGKLIMIIMEVLGEGPLGLEIGFVNGAIVTRTQ